jgi:hypothetical protein
LLGDTLLTNNVIKTFRNAEVKAQLLQENDSKVGKLENTIKTHLEREGILREAQIALQGEVQALSQQLADSKAVYTRSREQLRVDQSSLEAAKNTITRLEAEVKTLNQEVVVYKRTSTEGASRNEQALIAYQRSMKEFTISKDNEIKSLENNLKDKLEKISVLSIFLLLYFYYLYIYIYMTVQYIMLSLDIAKANARSRQ